jgi:hypothetical protein
MAGVAVAATRWRRLVAWTAVILQSACVGKFMALAGTDSKKRHGTKKSNREKFHRAPS